LIVLWIPCASLAFPAVANEEGTPVFEQPDFDSKPSFNLHEGQKIEVSQRVFPAKNKMGTFHRIRTEDGKVGFVTDAEYTPGDVKKPKTKDIKSEASQAKIEKPKHQRPFSLTRYRGPTLDYVGYREQTLGFNPMANIVFYGFRAVGPDLLVDGDMVTEFNVNVFPGAPPFYQEATNNTASGWILHMDAIFESAFAQTSEVLTYIGFGPMFKYDHYNVSLTTSKNTPYAIEDMNVGAVFNVGFGVRLGKNCLRTEFKYNWEKTQYWGLGTSLLFQF